MQDFTGVPAVVDLAAMRDAMGALGGDAKKINPLVPVDLVIDHSVIVDNFGNASAFKANVALEYERNLERYQFLRWGQMAFDNFRVVPPGTGICHQVNLEYLAQVVWTKKDGKETIAYPDTLVGTDSHTTMVNGLSVLGWGVGGIEAEAAMLGQPMPMVIPDVVGFKLTGKLREGATATDLVLTVTAMLRKKGVVNKFVEFYGDGLADMPLANRATIANMAPEYGATCGFFPVDEITLGYLKTTNRGAGRQARRGLRQEAGPVALQEVAGADLHRHAVSSTSVKSSRAWPGRSARRTASRSPRPPSSSSATWRRSSTARTTASGSQCEGADYDLGHGDIVIAAITSCTNTSNPYVMLGAGLIARNAVKFGLKVKPWVKTSLAPGSQVVTEYLATSGLQKDLDKIGYNLVGYGCTSCIGNSGPLPDPVTKAIGDSDLVVCAVLSGNRNFEGRVNPLTRANYLASPMLVVVYALAGSMKIDITKDPIAHGQERQAGLSQGPLAFEHGSPEDGRQARHRQGLQEALCRRLQGRQVLAQHQDQADPDLQLGRQVDLRAQPALLRRHGQDPGRAQQHRRAPARSASSAIRSPPTTSRPPARSRRTARPAPISASTASRPRTSTSTARGAAITR